MGGARTALFNYLFAQKHKGQLILRIEDTDKERHQEESVKSLLQTLEQLGILWDEGVYFKEERLIDKGAYGPYRQSERLSIYKEQVQKLLNEGKAFYCFLTDDEITQMREAAKQQKQALHFLSPHRNQTKEESEERIRKGEKACIRFKSTDTKKHYTIKDIVRGEVTFPADMAGDFVLMRSDHFPVYNFSCAVDDSLMKITHVFRAEEHLPNTLKQVLIQEALGLPSPQTGHLSIILGADKKKLSKRHGAKSTEEFLKEGFLPSGLNNFLALLGWNPKTEKEYFSKEELVLAFSVENLNSSSAIFDEEKLLWLNGEHIKKINNKELWILLNPFFKKNSLTFTEDEEWKDRIMEHLKTGFKTLKQATELLKPFSIEGFLVEESCLPILKWEKSKSLVELWKKNLEDLSQEELSSDDFKKIQKEISSQLNIKGKEFFMPLRCALMGKPEGVEIKLLISFLKRKELIRRASLVLKEI